MIPVPVKLPIKPKRELTALSASPAWSGSVGSVFSGSVFSGSVFSGSVFSGSVFSGSVFSGSVFSGSLTAAGTFAFSGSVVPGSVVPGSVVPGSVVPGSVVPGSVVPGSVAPGSSVGVGSVSLLPSKTPDSNRILTSVSGSDILVTYVAMGVSSIDSTKMTLSVEVIEPPIRLPAMPPILRGRLLRSLRAVFFFSSRSKSITLLIRRW
ncbi:MAG: pentapeptide repeat-containing protein [Oscillospiraceae bacterium]|nr:pentapeptide repeat-containing protein [Oscillospiraceae bacterium]